ncbi:putative EBP domain protein, partial [Conidiobolus coronatus NRRL 28638]
MSNHPYYPKTLHLPNYLPQTHSALQILLTLALTLGSVQAFAYYKISQKNLGKKYNLQFIWFLTSGLIHSTIEVYFILNNTRLVEDLGVMGSLWKEYAKSDSRYLTQDSLILVMESITVLIWGPLSLLTSYLIYTYNPARHLTIILVCLAHLYGCTIYYLTTLYEGSIHCDPQAYYFWGYFIGFNAPWIIFPIGILLNSSKVIL